MQSTEGVYLADFAVAEILFHLFRGNDHQDRKRCSSCMIQLADYDLRPFPRS